ncbi:MAG: short-chain dehydrogenase/reductase, partial [Cyclobacteriaceae bacterium]
NPNNTVSPPSLVAEVIYNSVTDGTNQLKHRAGEDANFLLGNRKKMTDAAFFEMMNSQLGK